MKTFQQILQEFSNAITILDNMVKNPKEGALDFYIDLLLENCIDPEKAMVLKSVPARSTYTNPPQALLDFQENFKKINIHGKRLVVPFAASGHQVGAIIEPRPITQPVSPLIYYFDSEGHGPTESVLKLIQTIFPEAEIKLMVDHNNPQQSGNSHCVTFATKNLLDFLLTKKITADSQNIETIRDSVLALLEKITAIYAKAVFIYLKNIYHTLKNANFVAEVKTLKLSSQYNQIIPIFNDILESFSKEMQEVFENEQLNYSYQQATSFHFNLEQLEKMANSIRAINYGQEFTASQENTHNDDDTVVAVEAEDDTTEILPVYEEDKETILFAALYNKFNQLHIDNENLQACPQLFISELENSREEFADFILNPKPDKLRSAFDNNDPILLQQWIDENKHTPRFNIRLNNAFKDAMEKHDKLPFVEACLKQPNIYINTADSLLIKALFSMKLELALLLIKHDADLSGMDADKNTALHAICQYPHSDLNQCLEIIKHLLEAGLDPNQGNALSETPLKSIKQWINIAENEIQESENDPDALKNAQQALAYWNTLQKALENTPIQIIQPAF